MKKIALALCLVASSSVFANVKGGKIGVDFSMSSTLSTLTTPSVQNGNGTTQSLGVWWHLTDMIALRPSVAYSSTTTTVENTATNTKASATTNTFGAGIAVPIYLTKMNLLDLYVAPGFSYGSNASNYTNMSFSASLGLQVAVNDQLQFFGEAGLAYVSTTDKATANVTTTTGTFGTARAAIGVIFYFN
jgi:hypothetical protein